MKKNKRRAGFACFVGLLLLGGAAAFLCRGTGGIYRVEVVQNTDSGYGYKIYERERVIIFQPYIPAVPGKKPFRSGEDARRVGNWVMDRIQSGDDFSVSATDLDKLGVGY